MYDYLKGIFFYRTKPKSVVKRKQTFPKAHSLHSFVRLLLSLDQAHLELEHAPQNHLGGLLKQMAGPHPWRF